MKQIMKRAWEIARQGVKKFGGKVKEYFAEALKMAWDEFKNATETVTTDRIVEEIHAAYGSGYAHRDVQVTFREWKKGDDRLHRLYINIYDKGLLNTVYIKLNDGSVHFEGKNATFKEFGAKVAAIVEKYKDFIIDNYVA